MSCAPTQRPTTVMIARPMAWPMIAPTASRLLATALAEMCTVPNSEIIDTTSTRPSWNRLFSQAEGMPMRKMLCTVPLSRWVTDRGVMCSTYSC